MEFLKGWQVLLVGNQPTVVFEADTVLFTSSNFPFAEVYEAFKNTENSSSGYRPLQNLVNVMLLTLQSLGMQVKAAKAILDKVIQWIYSMVAYGNVKNNQNWRDYMNKLER